jgi:hypothetical protein
MRSPELCPSLRNDIKILLGGKVSKMDGFSSSYHPLQLGREADVNRFSSISISILKFGHIGPQRNCSLEFFDQDLPGFDKPGEGPDANVSRASENMIICGSIVLLVVWAV